MIRLLGKLPRKLTLACSGGPDSMMALSFLTATRKRDVNVAYFNHGTDHGHEAEAFIRDHCLARELALKVGNITRHDRGNKSSEEHWRDERIAWLESLDEPVVTVHTLTDAVEWWLFTTLHGLPKLIPYRRNNIIRPFLMTGRQKVKDWNERHNVLSVTDPGNVDEKYMRSIIRHKMLPEALRINPGFEKVIAKKYANLVVT